MYCFHKISDIDGIRIVSRFTRFDDVLSAEHLFGLLDIVDLALVDDSMNIAKVNIFNIGERSCGENNALVVQFQVQKGNILNN
jgi:hypothetical protein